MMKALVRISLAIASTLVMQNIWAGDEMASHPMSKEEGAPHHEMGHHQPPPEAFAACKGKSKGAVCDVDTLDGKEKGMCMAPESKPLACVPSHPPRGAQEGKPPVPPAN